MLVDCSSEASDELKKAVKSAKNKTNDLYVWPAHLTMCLEGKKLGNLSLIIKGTPVKIRVRAGTGVIVTTLNERTN